MTKQDFFIELTKAALSAESTEDDILAVMIVFHTYRFCAKPYVVFDPGPKDGVLSAITRRDAAEVVSEVMESVGCKIDPVDWAFAYNDRTPFEVVADIPDSWQELTQSAIEKMKCSHSLDTYPEN